jgi:hypothetical protein
VSVVFRVPPTASTTGPDGGVLPDCRRGDEAYYGITGNGAALRRLRYESARVWQKWLNRRSHRAAMPWERFQGLLQRYPLPAPVLYPSMYRHVAKPGT